MRKETAQLWSLLLALAACQGSGERMEEVEAPRLRQSYGLIEYGLVEEQQQGFLRPIAPTYRSTVDPRSDLVLTWKVSEPEGLSGSRADPDWSRLDDILRSVESLAARREELALRAIRVNPGNVDELATLHADSDALYADVRTLLLQTLGRQQGLDPAEQLQILSGEFDNRRNPTRPYENLSRWLRGEIERLREAANDEYDGKPDMLVEVKAFLHPVTGDARAVHIPNWDDIADGEVSTQGLRSKFFTPGELRRFQEQLAFNTAVKNSIREISSSRDAVRSSITGLREQIVAQLENWESQLDAAAEALGGSKEALDLITDSNLRSSVAALTNEIEELAGVVEGLRQQYDSLRDLRGQLSSFRVSDILMDPERVQALWVEIDTWVNASRQQIDQLREVPAKLDNIIEQSVSLADAAVDALSEEAASTLRTALGESLRDASSSLPRTFELLGLMAEMLDARSVGIQRGAAELEETEGTTIQRSVAELLPARVDLGGMAEGDQLTVEVEFLESAADGEDPEFRHHEEYVFDLERVGWYRDLAGALIFARASQGDGDAKDWKPNVAALLNWHYRYPEESNTWRQFWNGWNPGLGLHLAALDQGDDSFEIGIGVNVSFWQQYLYGGVGWNLNVNDDRGYYFIGSNLFEILNAIRDKSN